MKLINDIEIKQATRLCEVNGKFGYFHCWTVEAYPTAPSISIGSHPGGQVSTTLGIVEFSDGVSKVCPEDIKFIDEENKFLRSLDAIPKEKKDEVN